jgi:hypothetical protein
MYCQIHALFPLVQDSFASVIIPLKDDVSLQEKYVTFKGYVRLGRLLEDMDIFAGEYQMITYAVVSNIDCNFTYLKEFQWSKTLGLLHRFLLK